MCVHTVVDYNSERSAVVYDVASDLGYNLVATTVPAGSIRGGWVWKKQQRPRFCYSQGLRLQSHAVPFPRASSLGRVCGSGGGLTAWTRLGNMCLMPQVVRRHRILCIYTCLFLYAHACMRLPAAAYLLGGAGLLSHTSYCCPSDPVHGSDIQFIAAIVHYRAAIYLFTAQSMLSTHAHACCNPK